MTENIFTDFQKLAVKLAASTSSDPNKKRDRTDDTDIEPSSVLHIGNLASNTLEIDLIRTFADCGELKDVVILPSKHQAFMEFEDQSGADYAIERSRIENGILIKGNRVFANYCKDKKINHDGALESVSPNKIILLSVTELVYSIECDTLYRICSPHGRPLRIVIVKKPFIQNVQGMVEYGSIEEAKRAKQNLNGADIYPGCCRLKVTYANQSRLNVQRNDGQHCDYEKTYQLAATAKSTPAPTPSKTQILDGPGGVAYACATITSAGIGNGDPAAFDPAMSAALQAFDPYQNSNRPPTAPGAGLGNTINQGPPYLGPQKGASLGKGGTDSAVKVTGRVLLALNVDKERMTLDQVFNLFCLYGNVLRVKFLQKKDGFMLEYSDVLECERALKSLNNVSLYDRRMTLWPSKQEQLILYRDPDGPQMKDFSDSHHHRFLHNKNVRSIAGPSRTLYYYGVSPGFREYDLKGILADLGAKMPLRVKVLNECSSKSHGLAEWSTVSDAVSALVLANHRPIDFYSPFEIDLDEEARSSRSRSPFHRSVRQMSRENRHYFLYLQFATGNIPDEKSVSNKENERDDTRAMPPPSLPGKKKKRQPRLKIPLPAGDPIPTSVPQSSGYDNMPVMAAHSSAVFIQPAVSAAPVRYSMPPPVIQVSPSPMIISTAVPQVSPFFIPPQPHSPVLIRGPHVVGPGIAENGNLRGIRMPQQAPRGFPVAFTGHPQHRFPNTLHHFPRHG